MRFTKKEQDWILNTIKIELDSYRSGGDKMKKTEFDFSGSFDDDMGDIKILKSVYKKLVTNSGGSANK